MKLSQFAFFSILCSLLFFSNGFAKGGNAGWSMGFGVKSQSQNNFLEHWDNSLSGYSFSLGFLGMGRPGRGHLELDLDFGFGSFRKYNNGEFERKTGFTSVDLRLGGASTLTKGAVAPHIGLGLIFFNGFIPHKINSYVEENIYKGLGVYFAFGPTIHISKDLIILGDLIYAYMGNISNEAYDPMGILEARLRAAFSL